MDAISRYMVDEEDIAYEYELQRTPRSIVTWKRYLESWNEKKRPLEHIVWLYERFCSQFPDQEDIWEDYMMWALSRQDFDPVNVFERFAKVLQDFPERCDALCIKILEFATGQFDLGMVRRALDICLDKIPRDAHSKAWEPVLGFIDQKLLPLTTQDDDQDKEEDEYEEMEILMYNTLFGGGKGEETADLWSSHILQRYISVASRWNLQESLNKLAQTKDYRTVHALYDQYLGQGNIFVPDEEIPYSMHLDYLRTLEKLQLDKQYESFCKQMKSAFPGKSIDVTLLLAKHNIRRSNFEKLTEILEEAMKETLDLKGLTTIYEFNVLYEKMYLETVIQELKTHPCLEHGRFELDSHLSRLRTLVETHSLRINDLKLRRNPNLIENWRQRVELFPSLKEKCNVYAKAILTIDPTKVAIPGSLGLLWCQYAQLYWDAGNYVSAREIWDRALRVPFPHLKDLETIWTSWTEHELDQAGLERGIQLLENALQLPDSPELILDNYRNGNKKVAAQTIVFTSLPLWSLYLDFEEAQSLDHAEHIEKTISIYEQAIALKVATPLLFINYAHFLQEHGHGKAESFRVYERAISIFPPETQYEIWNLYLAEATDPSSALSQEGIRDLFDYALEGLVPSGIDCRPIFVLYSDFEEKNGLAKRSVDILLRGCRENNTLELWAQCVSKAKHLLGGEAARPYYEECLRSVSNSQATSFILDFAEIESQLGEMERSREILKYGAQLLPPANNNELWEFWDEFELRNGDKESYKSMLKLKRNLEDKMVVNTQLESQREGNVQFVAASEKNAALNPEEIDLNI